MTVLEAGTQFGQFRVLRLLGAGGAGEVYLATDQNSARVVALKLLSEDAATDEIIRESFEREARLSLDLIHPNLVRCLEADVTGKRPWIAFEYVEGNSLADVLESKGAMDPWLSADVVLDVAYGLAAAHQKGVLHQDIKPHNILLTGDGTIKVIDFGAASAGRVSSEDFDPAFDLSTESLDDDAAAVAYSLPYASPEQLQGREVDASSDLYSLALVLYELLTGERLIRGQSMMAVVMEHMKLRGGFVPPSVRNPMLPRALDGIIEELLVFSREDRKLGDAVTLAERLERVLSAAGRSSVQRKSQRLLARLGLAETDYERARRLLRRDRLVEAMLVFGSLLELPPSVSTSYRDRVRAELRALLLEWHGRFLREEGGQSFHEAYLAVLPQLAALAARAEDPDLLRLTERRCATMAQRILEPDDRLDWLHQLEIAFPDSAHLGLLRIGAGLERDDDGAQLRALAFADALVARGWHDAARSCCLELRRKHPDFLPLQERLSRIEAAREGADEDRKAAQNIIDRARGQGDEDGARMACQTYVELHPEDTVGWEQLADMHFASGDESGGLEALRNGARKAFERGELFVAHALLTRVLAHEREDDGAVSFLYEIFASMGIVLRAPRDLLQFRIAILLLEGLEELAIEQTVGAISESDEDRPFLENILAIAQEARSDALASTVHFHLARQALNASLRDSAREHFGRALVTAANPRAVLTRIRILPGISEVLSPRELRGLATLAAKEKLKEDEFPVDP